ncbi:DUF3081 family protein [uncultured Pseudoteredinibacter sp.]|uniref:DUF3081 family protein n=1 Tax=uncultured Pseudoteredinibacter sp. TaxID=1641701 RepID=UPI0026336799|nr:DUF3081 family protein [uncultured Pseudoteredinibacter sp.]
MTQTADRRRLLLAAGLIETHGRVTDNGYSLDQVELDKGSDGYQVTLSFFGVNVTLGFHNTINSGGAGRKELEKFYQRLDRIIKNYS